MLSVQEAPPELLLAMKPAHGRHADGGLECPWQLKISLFDWAWDGPLIETFKWAEAERRSKLG